MSIIPAELFLLHQQFVVEESLAVIRHDLRNKLGSIRNGAFYVRRKLEKTAPEVATKDPRVPEFLGMIATELDAAEVILQSRLPASEQRTEIVAAPAIVQRVRELVAFPPNVRVVVEAEAEPRVRIAGDEAALAMYCFVQNALDAVGDSDATIRLRVSVTDGHAAFEVEDDGPGFAEGAHARALEPYFTTRTGQMGVGLNIARRISMRWNAKLAVTPLERGVRATLALKVES